MSSGSILVAVGAVIEDDAGRILLVRHVPERGGFWRGKWICPGGRLEYGERIEEGIVREVMEETGLEIALTRPLLPFETVVREGADIQLHVIYIDYMARLERGQLRPASDVGEGMWVYREDIPAMWAELHDDTKRLLKIALGEGIEPLSAQS
ncbi:MAG: NUDIX domain-containing protein [Chloroflexota bacterium]|nr:NUDIX domain-containing protein [Chloroflexota bacterium]